MSRRPNLTRDTENKKIAGVCSGLARYFDVDPVIVRVLFVVFFFVGGGALLAYLILWLVIGTEADAPSAPTAPPAPAPERTETVDEVIAPEPVSN